jgi:hypothetical protein
MTRITFLQREWFGHIRGYSCAQGKVVGHLKTYLYEELSGREEHRSDQPHRDVALQNPTVTPQTVTLCGNAS